MKKRSRFVKTMLTVLFVAGTITVANAADKKGAASKDGHSSVEDLFAKKDSLNGKKVTVHGKVTKINTGIMGKTWIHIKDGTGKQGTDDIIALTAASEAKVGDTVTATGTLVADRDFGSGYKYAAIIEESTIAVEK